MSSPSARPIPIDIRPKGGIVTWATVPYSAFREPFFSQTIDRLRSEGSLEVYETDLDPLLRAAEEMQQPPAGFIFHMSRSGSTLVANALRSIADALVISEARVINNVLGAVAQRIDPELERALLRGVIAAIGNCRPAGTEPYFIKFGSWNTLQLSLIRAAWPEVRWAFVARDPVAVIVSNLQQRPGWLEVKSLPASPNLLGWTRAARRRMSDEEFCARAIGRFCEIAAEQLDDQGSVIDYAQLTPGTIMQFARSCGIELAPGDEAAIADTMRIDSKDETGARVFVPDDVAKQSAATPLIREVAERFARLPYQQLLQRQRIDRQEFT